MTRMTKRKRWAIAVATVLGVAALGGGAGVGVHYWSDLNATCRNSGATIVTKGRDGKCAGVTDGSFNFLPGNAAFTSVIRKIQAEDQRVARPGNLYASVAYLLPVSPSGVEKVQVMTEQLEGAYTEQMYANRNSVAGHNPPVQLLIASDGDQGTDWTTAVRNIEHEAAGQHLVAVAGLGVSLDSTTDAVRRLTHAGIPVVGSTVTSDDYDHINGMFRVSSNNKADVAAVLQYVAPTFRSAIVINDTNPHDSYDKTLVQEFGPGFTSFARHSLENTFRYNTNAGPGESGSAALENATNAIDGIPDTICADKGSVVLFAGRGKELAQLLGDLASRCENQPITIVSGDDVTNMPWSRGVQRALHHVTLYYAGAANPYEWDTGSCPAIASGRQAFQTFNSSFTRFAAAHESPAAAEAMIADGDAIMGYDAMLTTTSAIRRASATDPTAAGVMAQLPTLQGAHTVQGASGFIALSSSGTNPSSKAIPILQYQADSSITFRKLYWPTAPEGELGQAADLTRTCP